MGKPCVSIKPEYNRAPTVGCIITVIEVILEVGNIGELSEIISTASHYGYAVPVEQFYVSTDLDATSAVGRKRAIEIQGDD